MSEGPQEMHTAQVVYLPLPVEVMERLALGEDTMVDTETLGAAIRDLHEKWKGSDRKAVEGLEHLQLDDTDFSSFSNKVMDIAAENYEEFRMILIAVEPLDSEPGYMMTGRGHGGAVGYGEGGANAIFFDLLMHTISMGQQSGLEDSDLAPLTALARRVADTLKEEDKT